MRGQRVHASTVCRTVAAQFTAYRARQPGIVLLRYSTMPLNRSIIFITEACRQFMKFYAVESVGRRISGYSAEVSGLL
jgi:hypothetical protein